MHKLLMAILAAGSMAQTAQAEEISFQYDELAQTAYSSDFSELNSEALRRGPGYGPRPNPGHGGPRRPDPYPYPGPGHGGPRPPHNPPYPGPPGPRPPSYPPPYYRTEFVQCASFDYYRTTECYVGNYRLQSIRFYRQESRDACIYGRTFGIYGDRVWVSHGCRATFAVERY